MSWWLLMTLAAVEAPVTDVMVFTDEARVVRTATLAVGAETKLEFPALKQTVDVSSIRVEARGAEVRRVDLERVEPDALPMDEARALLAKIDQADAQLERLQQEEAALRTQLEALARITPTAPAGDPLKAPPKLNGSGWVQSAKFVADETAKLQARWRQTQHAREEQQKARGKLAEAARKLGDPSREPGWKVVALLHGAGQATVTLTYVMRHARWTPTWDLQLDSDANQVSLSLAGLVAQETGEDWQQAHLSLSTAVPSHAVEAPKLATWKIGVVDRFIPTPTPIVSPIVPPPPVRPLATAQTEEPVLRQRLAQAAAGAPAEVDESTLEDGAEGGVVGGVVGSVVYGKAAEMQPPGNAPAPARRDSKVTFQAAGESVALRSDSVGSIFREKPQPVTTFSLSPPGGWVAPSYGPDSPVTLSEGADLTFESLQRETVPSGHGARRVALWSARWPVNVERKLYPALTKDAYLVAELKNPSKQVLPGGPAQLFVGADPAGVAQLQLVSPGESFTLPLGIDRALKPVRNVQVTEATEGLISKDEVGTYTVTIELTNPYRAPIAVRVIDQYPLGPQERVETRLLSTQPQATVDAEKGSLEWRATIAAQQKQVFTFRYTFKRPRGWQPYQQEVIK